MWPHLLQSDSMWVSLCTGLSGQEMQDLKDDPTGVWHGHFWKMPRGPKYPCPVCLEYFVTKLSLTTHIKGHQRPTCYLCCLVYTEEDLDDHVTQCHKPTLEVPQNSPVMVTVREEEEEAEVSDDSGFQTPGYIQMPQMDLSFANIESSTPKAAPKRQYKRQTALHSDLVKRITTRSGRKINFKPKDI